MGKVRKANTCGFDHLEHEICGTNCLNCKHDIIPELQTLSQNRKQYGFFDSSQHQLLIEYIRAFSWVAWSALNFEKLPTKLDYELAGITLYFKFPYLAYRSSILTVNKLFVTHYNVVLSRYKCLLMYLSTNKSSGHP